MPPITGRGINQADLLSLLKLIQIQYLALANHLEGQSIDGIANYVFTYPSNLKSPGIFTQGAVLDYLKTVHDAFENFLIILDGDGNLSFELYFESYFPETRIGDLTRSSLTQAGIYEGSLVKMLGDYIAGWNGMCVELDLDPIIAGTGNRSTYGISPNLVDTTGCVHKPGTGSTVG